MQNLIALSPFRKPLCSCGGWTPSVLLCFCLVCLLSYDSLKVPSEKAANSRRVWISVGCGRDSACLKSKLMSFFRGGGDLCGQWLCE